MGLAEYERELVETKAQLADTIRRASKKRSTCFSTEINRLISRKKNLETKINQLKQRASKNERK
jgi:hypothetical protein